jgi:hypothetical protein
MTDLPDLGFSARFKKTMPRVSGNTHPRRSACVIEAGGTSGTGADLKHPGAVKRSLLSMRRGFT